MVFYTTRWNFDRRHHRRGQCGTPVNISLTPTNGHQGPFPTEPHGAISTSPTPDYSISTNDYGTQDNYHYGQFPRLPVYICKSDSDDERTSDEELFIIKFPNLGSLYRKLLHLSTRAGLVDGKKPGEYFGSKSGVEGLGRH